MSNVLLFVNYCNKSTSSRIVPKQKELVFSSGYPSHQKWVDFPQLHTYTDIRELQESSVYSRYTGKQTLHWLLSVPKTQGRTQSQEVLKWQWSHWGVDKCWEVGQMVLWRTDEAAERIDEVISKHCLKTPCRLKFIDLSLYNYDWMSIACPSRSVSSDLTCHLGK